MPRPAVPGRRGEGGSGNEAAKPGLAIRPLSGYNTARRTMPAITAGSNHAKEMIDMLQVNIPEETIELSRLITLIETGREENIIITRDGKPVARMTAFDGQPASKRIGIAKGILKSPDDLDKYNDEIAAMFGDCL